MRRDPPDAYGRSSTTPFERLRESVRRHIREDVELADAERPSGSR
jgi:hypothetical protein